MSGAEAKREARRRCRSTRGKRMPSRCDLPTGHSGPHFHDAIETFHAWARDGEAFTGNVSESETECAGATAYAHVPILRLVIAARTARLSRHRILAQQRRRR